MIEYVIDEFSSDSIPAYKARSGKRHAWSSVKHYNGEHSKAIWHLRPRQPLVARSVSKTSYTTMGTRAHWRDHRASDRCSRCCACDLGNRGPAGSGWNDFQHRRDTCTSTPGSAPISGHDPEGRSPPADPSTVSRGPAGNRRRTSSSARGRANPLLRELSRGQFFSAAVDDRRFRLRYPGVPIVELEQGLRHYLDWAIRNDLV